MNYLSLSDCLLLRQANVELKRIVDSTFQRLSVRPKEKFQAELQLDLNQLSPKSRFFSRREQLITPRQVESLVRDTATWLVPHGNPWLNGHVHVELDYVEHPIQHQVRYLISRFGGHISSLTVDTVDLDITPTFDQLLELLGSNNFPNLKQLRLSGVVSVDLTSALGERVDSFPDLDKLEALDLIFFSSMGGEECLLFPLLQKYGSHLTVFRCGHFFLSCPNITVDLVNDLLPNISFLEIWMDDEEGFHKLSQVGWKIKQLSLKYFVKFLDVLKVLNHFASTLTHLQLEPKWLSVDFGDRGRTREEMRPLMELKHLTVLAFALDGTTLSLYDFIKRSCHNVRTLVWQEGDLSHAMVKEVGNKIKMFFGLMPKLRKIVCRYCNGREYSRLTLLRDGV